MKPAVITPQESAEFYFKEGCHIVELRNSIEDPALSIARARVARGVTTRLHALKNTVERYYILSGQGTVSVGDLKRSVTSGDTVIIPADTSQKIHNDGDEDLLFLAICTPRFQVQNYCELESESD